uniref:Zinc finger PMZ-type domain-containing protein n=1 Tax=Lactuca sativa TaxID=4236 RepID=A0A9R1WHV5_LACSA|nr:hypothetical protein LSAT_V11C200090620 [Lactuca sativa]
MGRRQGALKVRYTRLNPTQQSQLELFKNNFKRNIKLDSVFTRDCRLPFLSCSHVLSTVFVSVPEFNHRMKEFSSYDIEAYNWLKQIPPQHWARSHFIASDMLLNNLYEVFNSKLIEGRDKPLITCLEYIREYMMKTICNVIKVKNNCRKWELTGLPCKHVIAVLNDKADNGEEVGELHTYAHRVHWLETWKATYVYKVEPIKVRAMWPISDCPIKITPPLHHNQPRRPKKKRRQSVEEKSQKKGDNGASGSQSHVASGSGKLTRKFIKVTCNKCKNKGHNTRTCKGQGGK